MGKMRIAATVAAIVWMGVIFGLSSIPGSSLPGRFPGLGHFVVYTALGFLYCLALGRREPWWRTLLLAVLLASAYGVTDEFHQSFVPDRMPDAVDWMVDTAGAAFGAGVLTMWWHRRRAGDRASHSPC